MANLNTPPHVYITVWEDLHNTAQTYTQTKGARFLFSPVLLLLPPALCPEDTVFHCDSETILFGLPKEDTARNQWLSCIYNTLPEQFNQNIRGCAVHFTEDYFLNLGVAYNASCATKAVSIKLGNSNSEATQQMGCFSTNKKCYFYKNNGLILFHKLVIFSKGLFYLYSF